MTAPARLFDSLLARWPWWAFVASALMLATAILWFQDYRGLAPCILCLKQREVYWVAGAIALVGVAAGFAPGVKAWGPRLVSAVLCVAFLAGMGIAVYHAGAEWKFWPGPAACAVTKVRITAADMAAALAGAKPHGPSCEEAAWRMFGVSMAGYNVVISLGLALMSAAAAARRSRP